jgi:hypothetical protein
LTSFPAKFRPNIAPIIANADDLPSRERRKTAMNRTHDRAAPRIASASDYGASE